VNRSDAAIRDHHYHGDLRQQGLQRSTHLPSVLGSIRSYYSALFHSRHSNVVDQERAVVPNHCIPGQCSCPSNFVRANIPLSQIANSCAAIIGPLLSYAIGKAVTDGHSSIRPYQGIFLFIGAISFALVPVVWYLMPNSPTTAKFLKNGDDRLIAIDRLKENNTGTKSSKFKWDQFWETYRDPKTYMWAGMWFCAACPSGGIGAFGGLITKVC
jgi:hypothetical protein